MSHIVDRTPLPMIENGTANSPVIHWPGGRGQFEVEATFNSATISLQAPLPGGTYAVLGSDCTLTANGRGNFEHPEGPIKAVVAGGPPSAVYAKVSPI